ncbi:MAG: MgtC/SapB family protein [Myxococcales bacterium]|nr:MgtC/SapB family protein [Myxococcales bacterium]
MLAPREILVRLLLAAALGAVVGFERERHEWAAGLRTHMLVCVGAALAIIVSAFGFRDVLGAPAVTLDPSRIAAQVISGIGFLGAGTIIFLERENVIHGLTTAAGLWVVAAVGLGVGAGMYLAAGVATAIAWTTLAVLKPLERRFLARPGRARILVRVEASADLQAIQAILAAEGQPPQKLTLQRQGDADEVELLFPRGLAPDKLAQLAAVLRAVPGLRAIEVGR